MKSYFLFLAVFHILLVGLAQAEIPHSDISVLEANALIASNDDLIIIDVRNDYEYCDPPGHIPGAYNYPAYTTLQSSYDDFSVDDTILVVCQSGSRSNYAATFLGSKDFKHVYDMEGGTGLWIALGYPTVSCVDSDDDEFNDDLDNCPTVFNPAQTDSDGDGIGNVCDNDCPELEGFDLVNIADLAIFSANWQQTGPALAGDLDMDEDVDIEDLRIFVKYWLSTCTVPENSNDN